MYIRICIGLRTDFVTSAFDDDEYSNINHHRIHVQIGHDRPTTDQVLDKIV